MIIDLKKEEVAKHHKCDVCIAGAGAAGITIARELANTGVNVVLLESGGFERNVDTEALNEGTSSGNILHEGYVNSSRLRYFGGSTNHWVGWCRPLDEIDFKKREWVPGSGWPISKDQIESYYRRAEEIVEINSFDELDKMQNFMDDSGNIRAPFFQFSPPTRFGEKYRNDVTKASNITVLLNANVHNIRLSDNKKQVNQVWVRSISNNKTVIKPRKLIIACGGLENPRILLNCRDDIPEGLGNQNGLVGKYFMEHPHIRDCGIALLRKDDDDPSPLWDFFKRHNVEDVPSMRLFALSEKLQEEKNLINISVNIFNDRYLRAGNDDFFYKSLSKLNEAFQLNDNKKESTKSFLAHMFIRAEQLPRKSNAVTLTTEKDAIGLQRIKLKCNVSNIENELYRQSLMELGKYLGWNNKGRISIEIIDEYSYGGGYHHMGTTRMSDDPAKGVVDHNCKVFGIENMYVAGSSVFPTSGFANPTLTIVALSIRIAEHVKKDLMHG